MNFMEKIRLWAPVVHKLHQVSTLSKSMKRKIPLRIRKKYYLKHVVDGYADYNKSLAKYIKDHNLS